MKYFTSELITALQNEEKYEEAKIRFENTIDEYHEQFEKLKSRLTLKTYNFFKKNSLHDTKIISIKLVDNYNMQIAEVSNPKSIKQPISMILEVINGFSDYIFILKYTNIIRFSFNHSLEKSPYKHLHNGFGDIGYDELTEKDNQYFKHEFLFSTGNILEIEFKKINAYRQKIN